MRRPLTLHQGPPTPAATRNLFRFIYLIRWDKFLLAPCGLAWSLHLHCWGIPHAQEKLVRLAKTQQWVASLWLGFAAATAGGATICTARAGAHRERPEEGKTPKAEKKMAPVSTPASGPLRIARPERL